MRKFLLSLLILLTTSLPAFAQRSIYGLAQKGVYLILHPIDGDMAYGTGFCVPGRSQFLITASHVIGPGLRVKGQDGVEHPVKAVVANDAKADVAVIALEDSPCEFSALEFAKDSGTTGQDLWLVGYGGGFEKPIYTKGILSSDTGTFPRYPKNRAAQLGALGGHSGGPVFNSQNQIVGMLVGVYTDMDNIDVIVPVEVIKKVVK